MTNVANPKKGSFKSKLIAMAVTIAVIGAVVYILWPTPKCQNFSLESSDKQAGTEVVVIVAPTSNFVDFESVLDVSENEIKSALGANLTNQSDLEKANGNQLSMIVADGTPELISRTVVESIENNAEDIKSAISGAIKPVSLVASCAGGALAASGDSITTSDESDLLKALVIAENQFTEKSGTKELFILGNGINTAGTLKMQESTEDGSGTIFPNSEKKAIELAKNFYKSGYTPTDLKGANVHLVGIGQTDPDVQDLPEPARKALITFWSEVIRLSNGNLVDVNELPGKGKASSAAIKVSAPIKVVACAPITLRESDGITFKPGKADFVNKAAAKAKANEVAELYSAKQCAMSITGFAAPGTTKSAYEKDKADIDSTNLSLTKRRAQAFIKLLNDAGFTEVTVGNGGGTCVGDDLIGAFKTDGSINETGQSKCRRVEISQG